MFQQVYDPVAGSILLSALVAALPPILLAIMLAVLRVAPWKSAIAAATTAFVLGGSSGACRFRSPSPR
jgi:lactate permease